VIGGGDWAQDRIIPDLVNAYSSEKLPTLRYPDAIRPWQHVLDCLNGYLSLVDNMLESNVGGEWNFGPSLIAKNSVSGLVGTFATEWGIQGISWVLSSENHSQEANYLLLDSSKSNRELDWSDKLNFLESVRWTVEWYKKYESAGSLLVTREQIRSFYLK
jgi:CDP-glucose 4,6-dehydratase